MIVHSILQPSYCLFICISTLFVSIALSSNPTTEASTGCQHYNGGSNCPAEAPCCQSGWCSNAQSFCSLALGCQPENSFSPNTCLPIPLCTSFTENFDNPETMIALSNFSGNPSDASWTSDFLPSNAVIQDGNLVLTLLPGQSFNKFGKRPGFGATVSSTRWMHYGTVTARIKSGSPSGGVVSSFIYRSSLTGDEIDFEWVGQAPAEVQSNYYYRTPSSMDPKDIDYSHSRRANISSSPSSLVDLTQDYQTYTIEWLPDKLTWLINGQVVRQLLKTETSNSGTQYPDTPSQIQFSIWDGGLGDPSTIEWAGGPTDWSSQRPSYQMWIDYIDVKCYSPLDAQAAKTWPPEGQGFQGFVNPLERDPTSPLAKDAIVLGENAPTFSTLERGGLHWGRFLGGGKILIGGKYPIPTKKSQASSSFRTPSWTMMNSKGTGGGSGASRWEAMVVALSAIAIAFFGLA